MEASLRAFIIRAVDHEGQVVDLVTTDTATLALSKFHDALDSYLRARVSDDNGEDVSLADLILQAGEEQKDP